MQVSVNTGGVESEANVTEIHEALHMDLMADGSSLNHHFGIFGINFSPDGKEVVAGTGEHSILIFNMETEKVPLHSSADDHCYAGCHAHSWLGCSSRGHSEPRSIYSFHTLLMSILHNLDFGMALSLPRSTKEIQGIFRSKVRLTEVVQHCFALLPNAWLKLPVSSLHHFHTSGHESQDCML